jgi:xylulokinase
VVDDVSSRDSTQCILTIDVGTTTCKTFVFRTNGTIVSAITREHPTYYPQLGWTEQDPSDWWDSIKQTTREALAIAKKSGTSIAAVSLTGQMHSAIPISASGEPLYNCITLTDRRSMHQCKKIEEKISRAKIHQITGNRLDPYITAPKLLWLKEEKPELFKRMHKFLPPKDYIRFKLTGQLAIDHMEASGTLLYDIRKREWYKDLFDLFQIPMNSAPELLESTHLAGEITEQAARDTWIESGTPVVVGAADDIDILGTGSIKVGTARCHLGSTGGVVACTERPVCDSLTRVECYPHVIENLWLVGGPTSAAGTAVRWFRDNFAQDAVNQGMEQNESPYRILDAEAKDSPPGSILFLPYILGERCPVWDTNAKGVFFGIKASHSTIDFYRSILEGVALSLRDIVKTIEDLNVAIEEMRIADGGAESSLWRQIIADVTGKPLYFTGVQESASYGTMILATVFLRIYRSVEEACDALVHTRAVNKPNLDLYKKYTVLFRTYKKIYRSLSDDFVTFDRTDP